MQLSRSYGVSAIAYGLLLMSSAVTAYASSVAPKKPASEAALGQLAVPFIANQGQLDPQVAFYAPTFAGTVYVTKQGQVVYSLTSQQKAKSGERSQNGWTLTESLLTSSSLKPVAAGASASQVNYFMGRDRAGWHTGLSASARVSLGDAWPGIEVSLEAHGDSVKTFYTLAPQAQPGRIRLELAGAKRLRLEHGNLVAETDLGPVTFSVPRAWQDIAGTRRTVQASYNLQGRRYGFRLGPHDPHAPVVIDPDLQATFLGGSAGNTDLAVGLALGPAGDVYVAGYTTTSSFPGTTGGAQPTVAGRQDAFVSKLSADLSTLEQTTYLGGSDLEYANAIAVAPSGDVYVSGETASTDFPGTAGGAQAAYGATSYGYDGFIAKLNADLTVLEQATYLGGNSNDDVKTLVIDSAGDVYAAGDTSSTNFPGTAGGALAAANSVTETITVPHSVPPKTTQVTVNVGDTFVAKLNAGLTVLKQATYLGGTGMEFTQDVALDAAGDVYVAGYTYSSDFHGTTGGAQATRNGTTYGDVFIAKLDGGLTTLAQATYFGGSSDEYGRSLSVDPSGDVYVSGDTYSTDLPGTSGGAQAASAGNSEVFVTRLNPSLTAVDRTTYLGTSGNEWAYSMTISPSGDVYVAGVEYNTAFPGTAGGIQAAYGGGSCDVFIAKFNAALTQLTQSTYFGGTGMDELYFGRKLAFDVAGDLYVAGDTRSLSLPGTTGGYETANNEVSTPTVFVAKLPGDLRPHVDLDLSLGAPVSSTVGSTLQYSLSVTDDSSDVAATGVVLTDSLPAQVSFVSAVSSQGSCSNLAGTVTCHLGGLAASGGSATVTISATAISGGVAVDAAQITADQALSPDSIAVADVDTSIGSTLSLSSIPDQNLQVGQGTGALPFSISGPGTLTVSANSSNTQLVPVAKLALSAGCGASTDACTLAVTPATGQAGSSLITLTLTDSFGESVHTSFTVTVSDQAATANNGSIVTKFVGLVRGQLSATPAYIGQMLTYHVARLPAHGSLMSFDPATGTFSYKPTRHFLGTDSFTFTVTDAFGKVSNTAMESITLTPEHITVQKPPRMHR